MRWRPIPLSIRTRLTLWYTGILFGTLLVISGLSYSLLRWSLTQDLDASLLAVAQVIRDTGHTVPNLTLSQDEEAILREILGSEFYDKSVQLVDPQGKLGFRSPHLRNQALPFSPEARKRATRGARTFETVQLSGGAPVRLLTMPILQNRNLTQLIQVAMPLQRAQQALRRYLESLFLLIPLGLGLAAAGGAAIARTALKPVDEMSQSARRISGEDLARRIPVRGMGDELDRLAETLNAMLERLESAFGEIRRFAADAAHELRTPLTALRGGIEVALRANRSTEEYRHVLASSLEEVERLIRLAEDLLLLSRSSAGPNQSGERVDLESILLEVFDVGVRLAHGMGVTVRLGEIAPATVIGDSAALRRAIRNLLENAVKYTPAGGKVNLWLTRGLDSATLVIEDTGIGIDPADAERIFEPFVRLDAARSRDTGGAGLGLPIARSVVTAHGGTLSLESTPGVGSRFTIRLPIA